MKVNSPEKASEVSCNQIMCFIYEEWDLLRRDIQKSGLFAICVAFRLLSVVRDQVGSCDDHRLGVRLGPLGY